MSRTNLKLGRRLVHALITAMASYKGLWGWVIARVRGHTMSVAHPTTATQLVIIVRSLVYSSVSPIEFGENYSGRLVFRSENHAVHVSRVCYCLFVIFAGGLRRMLHHVSLHRHTGRIISRCWSETLPTESSVAVWFVTNNLHKAVMFDWSLLKNTGLKTSNTANG